MWRSRFGRRENGPVGIVAVAVVIVGLIVGLTRPPVAAGIDMAEVQAVLRAAMGARQVAYQLPADVTPGRVEQSRLRTLTDIAQQELSRYFAGGSLAHQMSNVRDWADRVASSPTEGYLVSYEFQSMDLDKTTVEDKMVTVTGRYTFVEQQAYPLPDGRVATYGGTYTNVFLAHLEKAGEIWRIVEYTEEPGTFTHDPLLESNLDVDPNPDETKPPVSDDEESSVDEGNPALY